MAEEGKGVALAILGVVAVIAVVGLVLLFTGTTGGWSMGGPGNAKLYTRQSMIDYAAGPADVENPYYAFDYENYQGVSLSRQATGKYTSAGGAWNPANVHGESPYGASTEPGDVPYAGTDPYTYQIAENRAPYSFTSDDGSACGFCPKGSVCQMNERRVPANWRPVAGYPNCYTITAHS
jgi:hypothetical protein